MITKEAIEAGVAAFESAFNGSPNSTEMVTTILTAAFAAMPGPAVKVKPLENERNKLAQAVKAAESHLQFQLNGIRHANAQPIVREIGNFIAAKIEQTNYEARILSALTPAPDLQAENDRLREALEKLVKSANEVNRLGASTGPQWLKMTGSIVSARAALERT